MKARFYYFLLSLFVLIFFVLVILIVIYAQGYALDFKKMVFVKTGNLFVGSKPSGAEVLLNAQLVKLNFLEKIFFYKNFLNLNKLKGSTPTLINRLKPGDYQLTVKKIDYLPWQKEITVEPEKTTLIRHIFLFLEKPEINFLQEIGLEAKFSPDFKNIAYLSKNSENEVIILNLDEQKEIKFNFLSKVKHFFWEQKEILIVQDAKDLFFIIGSKTKEAINLSNFLKLSFKPKNLKFFNSEKEFYFQDNFSIYRAEKWKKEYWPIFSLSKKSESVLIDYFIDRENIFTLEKTKGSFYLKSGKLDEKGDYYFWSLPSPQNRWQFSQSQSSDKNLISLIDGQNILVLDKRFKETEKAIVLQTTGKDFVWSPHLVVYNNYEIFIFTFQEGKIKEREIVSRYSEEIKKVLWFLQGTHLFIVFNNKLIISEINPGQKQNYYLEIIFDEINDLSVKDDLRTIYLIGKKNGKFGLFKIKI